MLIVIASAESVKIQVEGAEHYHSKRQRKALAMAATTADPAVRSIHLDPVA